MYYGAPANGTTASWQLQFNDNICMLTYTYIEILLSGTHSYNR